MSTIDNSIIVHQCVFGYQDGHRLLSSSTLIAEEASSHLLLMSDLAPGLSIPNQASYWTGTPLPGTKTYALMRTWLAPEMPRPGCVWTHVLIIEFADIARFPDLSILTRYLERPAFEKGFESYSVPINIASLSVDYYLSQNYSILDKKDAYHTIRALYSDHASGVINASLGSMDSLIFAIWSQQWPRLRRSFSFRTAASSINTFSAIRKFDLIVTQNSYDQIYEVDNYESPFKEAAWEDCSVNDLIHPGITDFRRFLWRYGSDIQNGRNHFRDLANIYISTREEKLSRESLYQLLANISKTLSSPNDGKVLKEDLIAPSKYSLLPKTDPIEILDFIITNSIAKKPPAFSYKILESIQENWPTRSDQILSIAEQAAQQDTDFGFDFLSKLATIVEPSTFLATTTTRPHLRNKLLRLNPMLLDSPDLATLLQTELFNYIKYIPTNNNTVIKSILPRLIVLDNFNVAKEIIRLYPNLTISTVLETVDQDFIRERSDTVSEVWINLVATYSDVILQGGFIERARTTSNLSFLAAILGYGLQQVLDMGPIPWAKGLKNAKDILRGADRQSFLAFLLEIALYKPITGCEPLFEIAFEEIHTDLLYSKLNYQKTASLLNHLPNLGWLKNWDTCLRLRTAVVEAYIKNNLNPKSFQQLTANNELYMELIEIAEGTKGGHRYLNKGGPSVFKEV
ncbi:MAG: hypothetical protein V9E92_07420 [Methylotenera sp.]